MGELAVCNPCWFDDHAHCNNTATWPDTGGMTNCWCSCWQDDEDDHG